MRHNIKTKLKLTACALVAVLGLSFMNSLITFADTDTPQNPDTRTYAIYTYVEGNGVVNVPDSVEEGANLHIEVIPDEGYEVRYAQINDYYFNEEIVDNTFDMIVSADDDTFYYNIYVGFWPVYEVVEGDGSEYLAGSGKDLSFKINTNLEGFDGTGILGVDDKWLAVDDEWMVDPENNLVLLSSRFLATLEPGEHSIELIFSEPDIAVARATFVIVKHSEKEEEEETILAPDTGIVTDSNDGVMLAIELVIITGMLVAAAGMVAKKTIHR